MTATNRQTHFMLANPITSGVVVLVLAGIWSMIGLSKYFENNVHKPEVFRKAELEVAVNSKLIDHEAEKIASDIEKKRIAEIDRDIAQADAAKMEAMLKESQDQGKFNEDLLLQKKRVLELNHEIAALELSIQAEREKVEKAKQAAIQSAKMKALQDSYFTGHTDLNGYKTLSMQAFQTLPKEIVGCKVNLRVIVDQLPNTYGNGVAKFHHPGAPQTYFCVTKDQCPNDLWKDMTSNRRIAVGQSLSLSAEIVSINETNLSAIKINGWLKG